MSKNVKKKKSLLTSIIEQRNDPGLGQGQRVLDSLDTETRNTSLILSGRVGNDFLAALRTFSSDGAVGRALGRAASGVTGSVDFNLPATSLVTGNVDTEQLLVALFDPRFQKSLYGFQLRLSKSNLTEQKDLIKRFAQIDWSKFNQSDAGWLNLINAGIQRNRVNDLDLLDAVPLMGVDCVFNMITVSASYARMMEAALAAYNQDKDFLMQIGDDNSEVLKEIDALLEKIQNSEFSRLQRLEEVKTGTENLKQLLEVATVIADMTNRSIEAELQNAAGKRLAEAQRLHSQDTLESQEAYLEHFMRLNQILVANEFREGSLTGALASLNLYVKAYQAFVLMLTSLQYYLFAASTSLKAFLADSLEGASRLLAEEIYSNRISPLNSSLQIYSQGFARIRPGQTRRQMSLTEKRNEMLDVDSQLAELDRILADEVEE